MPEYDDRDHRAVQAADWKAMADLWHQIACALFQRMADAARMDSPSTNLTFDELARARHKQIDQQTYQESIKVTLRDRPKIAGE